MTIKIEECSKTNSLLGKAEHTQHDEAEIDEETEIKRKLNKGLWGPTKDSVNVQASIERVQNFEEAFNKIKAATGIEDIEKLVQKFIQHEDQNFSLFNYVNEQANEIEKLEEQLQVLKEEEKKYSHGNGDDANQHKQLLNELESKLQNTDAMAEKYETKCTDTQKNINSIKLGIQSLFSKLDCTSSPGAEMLVDGTVTEANLMLYLGVIEQKITEILQIYASFQQTKDEAHSPEKPAPLPDDSGTSKGSLSATHMQMVLGLGPTTPMGHEQLQINPPNLEDYSSSNESASEDDEARPFTRDELKIRTLKGLQKKMSKDESGSPFRQRAQK